MSDTDVKHLTPYDEPYEAERAPFLWLAEREVLRFLNIWPYAIAGPVLSTILFVIVFGSALGHRVAPIDGVAYGQYIVPGLLAQAILTVGFVNGTTSLFEARRDKYINDVFASPLRWWEINAALVTGGVVRGFIVGAGVLAIAVPLTGTAFVARAVAMLHGGPPTAMAAAVLAIVAGLFLIAGLWTPIAGSLAAAVGIWFAFTHAADPLASVLLATIGAALALVGPGAWSIDARLFGWKRIDVRDRTK